VHSVGNAFLTVAAGVLTAAVLTVGSSKDHNWCAWWFWALALPAALLLIAGLYMLTAPWHGAPIIGKTLKEHATTPSLQIARVTTENVLTDHTVFQVGLLNDGPVDAVAHLNVLVPDFAEYIAQCRRDGSNFYVGPRNPTSASVPGAEGMGSIYWDSGTDGIRTPAGGAVPIYFRVGTSPKKFPVAVQVNSQGLQELTFAGEVGSDQVSA
jgi:hypothetical protein